MDLKWYTWLIIIWYVEFDCLSHIVKIVCIKYKHMFNKNIILYFTMRNWKRIYYTSKTHARIILFDVLNLL